MCKCHARQYSDQMVCAPCGLIWDANDPEPPACRKHIKRAVTKLAKLEDAPTKVPALPHELPADLAIEMVTVYHANLTADVNSRRKAMQATYRLFLDRIEL